MCVYVCEFFVSDYHYGKPYCLIFTVEQYHRWDIQQGINNNCLFIWICLSLWLHNTTQMSHLWFVSFSEILRGGIANWIQYAQTQIYSSDVCDLWNGKFGRLFNVLNWTKQGVIAGLTNLFYPRSLSVNKGLIIFRYIAEELGWFSKIIPFLYVYSTHREIESLMSQFHFLSVDVFSTHMYFYHSVKNEQKKLHHQHKIKHYSGYTYNLYVSMIAFHKNYGAKIQHGAQMVCSSHLLWVAAIMWLEPNCNTPANGNITAKPVGIWSQYNKSHPSNNIHVFSCSSIFHIHLCTAHPPTPINVFPIFRVE